ncbi:ATP-binding protein [Paenibacillus sp. CAA11]|uniref:ATP-binding protein n=1 Tax=Paenibacillus sp. CAA11 TaxID=1532905 RepID=UPI001F2D112F|nr:ATP-binding protein [Paenibacillus sp. CAA11]
MVKRWIILLISFFVVIVLPLYGVFYILKEEHPKAQNGIIDLRGWDFDREGTVPLDGEWEIYPNQLLTPMDFVGADGLLPKPERIHVPGKWNELMSQEAHGYATYRLHIRLGARTSDDYGIRVTNIRMASRAFLGGSELGASGRPGVTPKDTVSGNIPFAGVTGISGPEVELIVQVSNYSYSSGGIVNSIQFGNEDSIRKSQELAWMRDIGTLAGFLIPAVFFLFLFRLRRQERALLYLGMFCFCAAVFVLTHGEKMIGSLLPGLPYELVMRVQLISSALVYFYLMRYIDALVPGVMHKWAAKLAAVLTLLQLLMGTLLSPAEFSRLEPVMMFSAFAIIGYIVFIMGKWIVKWPEDVDFMLISAISVIMVIFLNLMSVFGILDIQFLALYEMIFFVAAQALMLARRFARSFHEVESLSKRLLTLDGLKDEFMANTSHELRTPLHGMINIAQSMLDGAAGELSPKQASNLSMIMSTGQRLTLLVNDILDFAKLKSGEVVLRRQTVELAGAARSVVELILYLIGRKNIQLIQQWPEELLYVEADEDRLRQIIYNLLAHAVKETAEGEVRIWAKPGKSVVTVSIADSSGPGAADQLSELLRNLVEAGGFDSRLDSSGWLGLVTAKQLIELSGGNLWIEASVHGAVLHFTLPAAQLEQIPAQARQVVHGTRSQNSETGSAWTAAREVSAGEQSDSGRDAILVVDDDPINRQVLINLLSTEGYSIVAVPGGQEALDELALQLQFSLVIADWMMPGMSGIELCRKLRERYTLSELPVLMLTARNLPEDIENAFRAGINDFLSKPVAASELRARVRTLIEMRRSVQAEIRTEMAFLQAQIKPHFLYNALNVIIATCPVNPDLATDLLIELSQYLRGSFDFQNRDQMVPLQKELELVHSYVVLEKARFEERVDVEFETDESIRNWLPPLSIQPIVENAIRHGIMQRAEGGKVKVAIREKAASIEVRVSDNGVGMTQEQVQRVLSGRGLGGVGLLNIHRRLMSLYGKGLEITSHPGHGTEVSFDIPKSI